MILLPCIFISIEVAHLGRLNNNLLADPIVVPTSTTGLYYVYLHIIINIIIIIFL